MKKKILFVINTLGRGGAENALIQLINNIDKHLTVYKKRINGRTV